MASTTQYLRTNSRSNGVHNAVLTGVAATGFFLAALFETGHAALACAAFAALAVTVLIYRGVRLLIPQALFLRLVPLNFAVQLLPLVLLSTLGQPLISSGQLAVDLTEFPLTITFALLLVPAASLVAALTVRLLGGSRAPMSPIEAGESLNLYLAFAAVLILLSWPASLESSVRSGYLVRVMASSFTLVPALAGWHLSKPSFTRNLWYASLTINGAIGLAAGTRQGALLPPALFVIGRIAALSGSLQKRTLWLIFAAGAPAMLIFSLLGEVRDTVGRGGVELFSIERFYEMSDISSSLLLQVSEGDQALEERLVFQGLGRLFYWANAVVPVATPKLVPYRGLDEISREIDGYAQINLISGRSQQDLYDADLATAPATMYGFEVDAGTSVEFGLVPDGWSRGGPSIVLLFGFIYTLFLILLEQGIRVLSAQAPALSAMLLTITAKATVYINILPLLALIRVTLLNVAFSILLLGIIEVIRNARRFPVHAQ